MSARMVFDDISALYDFTDFLPEDRREAYHEALWRVDDAVASACAALGGGDPERGWDILKTAEDFIRDVPSDDYEDAERSLPKARRTPLGVATVLERWAHDLHAGSLRRGADSSGRGHYAARLFMTAALLQAMTIRHSAEWDGDDGDGEDMA